MSVSALEHRELVLEIIEFVAARVEQRRVEHGEVGIKQDCRIADTAITADY